MLYCNSCMRATDLLYSAAYSGIGIRPLFDVFTVFLLLDETVNSRAVFVIVSGSDGNAFGAS